MFCPSLGFFAVDSWFLETAALSSGLVLVHWSQTFKDAVNWRMKIQELAF